MSEDFAVAKKESLTESDILASLESAISSYEKRDFEQIAKQSLTKTKGKRTRTKKVLEVPEHIEETIVVENQYFEEDPLEAAKIAIEEVKSQKKKAKTVKKAKSGKTKTAKRKRKGIFSRMRLAASVKNPAKGYASNYKRHLLTASLAIMMVGFVGFSSYMAYAYVSGNNADVVAKVGNHIILPQSETPKVYIVQSEKSEIFQNPLFKGIQVGDNVLSYTSSGKVIIYRSSEDKVVNIVNTSQ